MPESLRMHVSNLNRSHLTTYVGHGREVCQKSTWKAGWNQKTFNEKVIIFMKKKGK